MNNYLSLLNSQQYSAVIHIKGPVLILAGAGTGKTKTIISRIAYIICNGHANSHEILAVTFTNRAANEMLSRILKLTNIHNIPWFGTFHGIAVKILRDHANIVGLNSNFSIISVEEQLQIIKNIIKTIDSKNISNKYSNIMYTIQQWKEKCLTPYEVECLSNSNVAKNLIALQVYYQYQEILHRLNAVDFGDLLLYNIQIFNRNREILSYYQLKFKYIIVDEYQDTNTIQYLWLQYLAKHHANICCVGDDDQLIYSWRGAEVENIFNFSNDFANAKIFKLECNYRSTSHILAAASYMINHNQARLQKTLWTKNIAGDKVKIIKLVNSKDEARFIIQQILQLHQYRLSDIAVLVRASFQTRVLEEFFIKHSVPYKVLSGIRFYERQEVQDIIACLRLIINHNDDLAFSRIINRPKRYIGAITIQKIHKIAQCDNISYLAALKVLIDNHQVTERIRFALNKFFNDIKYLTDQISTCPLYSFVEKIVIQLGYITMLENEGITGIVRMENIKELISSLKDFDNPKTFLEHISLVMDTDNIKNNDEHYVYIMTLHASKGLEFPCVFLPGWEEGLFPHQRSFGDKTGKALEEERRLAYVGITRAKSKLLISCVERREINNQWHKMYISRFIKELPKEHIEIMTRKVFLP
ncbi:ATP-dependent helicase [Wolbachia endosymbiont of Howardula sp.]|uniref:ATP-dependent helicase n=1 Tax=Wolbachia endosymbiont of Howardula sp. TaxID=2916816 RepID=UPI00217E7FDD|nr:UvrD-helicase domain-containing protein [Wolbachia endosymbiont of Howardula sp.]UWI83223.1 UvrD-helicase domain-containing protein [Wolbachia endosymbiont of Howardula sp.]